jgi:hypothetical protein
MKNSMNDENDSFQTTEKARLPGEASRLDRESCGLVAEIPEFGFGNHFAGAYGGVTLEMGRAIIRPIWKQRVKLRLEWDREEFQEESSPEERTICDDLMGLSEQEFVNLLRTVDSEEEESDEI